MLIYYKYIINFSRNYVIENKKGYNDIIVFINNYINQLWLNHKFELMLVGIIFIVGSFLRLHFLFAPIRIDEAGIFIYLASKSLTVNIFSYPFPGHHIFNTILVNILCNILGANAWVMRLPALLAGILLIPAIYLLFRTISNIFTAALAATFVSVSSQLIEYSTNARGYSLIIFIFIASLLLIKYLSENKNIFGWLVFACLSAIGFYTITIYILPFGIIILWFLLIILFKTKNYIFIKDVGSSILVTSLLTFILYSPILMIYGTNVLLSNSVFVKLSLINFIKGLGPFVNFVWTDWNQEIFSIIKYVILFGFAISLVRIKYVNRELQLLLISSVSWIFITLIILRMIPLPRVLLFLIPIYYGFACHGLSYIIGKYAQNSIKLSIITSIILLITIGGQVFSSDIINNIDTGSQLFVDGEKIAQYINDHNLLKNKDTFLVNTTYSSQMRYYFKKYKLPLNQMTQWNSTVDKYFLDNMKKLIVIEVKCDRKLFSLPHFTCPKESKEQVLKDAQLNIKDFQPGIMLKKFQKASLYLYYKN
jgi:hypothetical protein